MFSAFIVTKITAEMAKSPELFTAYDEGRNGPSALIADFREQGVAARGYLNADDLYRIAMLKNGGKLSQKTKDALAANAESILRDFTRAAFTADDPELAVRVLLGLDGVRLPTASCILAWVLPHKWPVIDKRAWGSIAKFSGGDLAVEPVGGLKVKHWVEYVAIVQEVANVVGRTPQEVDVWLYAYDKRGEL